MLLMYYVKWLYRIPFVLPMVANALTEENVRKISILLDVRILKMECNVNGIWRNVWRKPVLLLRKQLVLIKNVKTISQDVH